MHERRDPSDAAARVGSFKVGFTPDIVTSDKVRQFHEFWQARRRDQEMPRKSDMDPAEMGPFLANIVLSEVFYDPLDFGYRIIGEEIKIRLGNMTGKRVREMALINVSSSAYQNYCAVVETRQPQFLEGEAVTAFRNDRPFLMSRVHCPLSNDGERIDFIISCLTFLGR